MYNYERQQYCVIAKSRNMIGICEVYDYSTKLQKDALTMCTDRLHAEYHSSM